MKVLLVSSYRVSCGIATYTETLETLLDKDFEVEVYALDQSILKSRIPHVVEAGDEQIRELCASFKDYDVVNFQWEPGLLGDGYKETAKRLGWILDAAENLILTVHTVVPYPKQRRLIDFVSFVRRQGVKNFYRYFLDAEDNYRRETYRVLQKRAKSARNTIVAVHTNREKQFFRNVVGFRNVFDHPLSLIHADWPEQLALDAPRARADLEKMFPGKHTFIGVFGFISEYKGMHTALRAMKLLDRGHQLLIYGGVHPGVLQEREPVNGYVKTLIDEIEIDALQAKKAKVASRTEAVEADTEDLPDMDEADAVGPDSVEPETVMVPMSDLPDMDGAGAVGPDTAEPETVIVPASDRSDRYGADAAEPETVMVPAGNLPDIDRIEPQAKARRSASPRPRSRASSSQPGNTLLDKVAFLGAPDDYDFALAMKTMDFCVFPYLEVGQSGSGPVSIAIELGKPTIASRTKAFIELARYHPKHFEMIDIGNHIQLGQAIQRMTKLSAGNRAVEYNGGTLAAFYGRLIRTVAGHPAGEAAQAPERQADRQAA